METMNKTLPKQLVEQFYFEVWNKADESTAHKILSKDFIFRGSLREEKVGIDGFIDYMRSIHKALGDYKCIIEDLIITENRVAAQMVFTGIHQNIFLGYEPTQKRVQWNGAAFFTIQNQEISELWVLGDIDAIKTQLNND
ncbi:hypothetical protein NBRC116602_20710 [Hyphomicrobiales bacterium 4NK60-0047b]